MSSLSLILNDTESMQSVPSCSRDVHSFNRPLDVSVCNDKQALLPPASSLGQPTYSTNLLMYPFSSVDIQSLCNHRSGEWKQMSSGSSTALGSTAAWTYRGGSLLVPSLLDCFASSAPREELNRDMVSRDAGFRYGNSGARMQVSSSSILALFRPPVPPIGPRCYQLCGYTQRVVLSSHLTSFRIES
jgi:hypothetical protein